MAALLEHPAYQLTTLMGEDVLWFIFEDLARTGDLWFYALEIITGEDPAWSVVPRDIRAVNAAWLAWAYEHGYSARSLVATR